MMNKKYFVLLLFYFCFFTCLAQEKTIDTVYIFDNQINKIKIFHKVTSISPDDVQKNSTNISELLRFQTSVYIKENGRGAVSSPSFRGTSAQQTAFIWNGININSTFLGQGDVNNISLLGYDQIDVKSGGGSVIYGSGAIGGSIHLNNDLAFDRGFQGSLFSEVASFKTYNDLLTTSFSNDKLSAKFSGSYVTSENDYVVKERDYINRNGNYYNTNFNFGVSYKISDDQKISWQSQLFDSSQKYPIFSENGTKTKYKTQSTRSLLSWDITRTKLSNSFKAAYTEDNFQYFPQIDAPKANGGTAKNYIFKNDLNYFIISKLNLNIIPEFQINKAEGYGSGITNVSRNMASFAGLLRYFASKDLRFEAGIKKDLVQDITSPILYSFSGNWKATNWYQINASVSKNFRIPSFNDLYWQPGGNLDLKPESSINFDMDHQFKYKDLTLNFSPYYMKIDDMIRWIPTSKGYWAPENTNNVASFGFETQLSYLKKINDHQINFKVGYNFTRSENLDTKKQLSYVPLFKTIGSLDYQYKNFKIYAQGLYNGLTYTTSDEKRSDALNPYFVLNTGISATIFKKYSLGFKINNLTDTIYETVAYYPLPKRNYSIYTNINF